MDQGVDRLKDIKGFKRKKNVSLNGMLSTRGVM